MAVWGGFTNSCEKERGKKQRRKGKIKASECRVPKNSKKRFKKAFFSDQCKEIKENNRMGKTRDLFKKIRATKGTFHAKMGSIKDRNGIDPEEGPLFLAEWACVCVLMCLSLCICVYAQMPTWSLPYLPHH